MRKSKIYIILHKKNPEKIAHSINIASQFDGIMAHNSIFFYKIGHFKLPCQKYSIISIYQFNKTAAETNMPHSNACMNTGFHEIKVNDEIVWEKRLAFRTHTLWMWTKFNYILHNLFCLNQSDYS